jgi:hypothetical protein
MLVSPISIAQESRRVKQILRQAGWTNGWLATHFRVSPSHISNQLRGHEANKWLQCEIARLMGQEPEDFWGELHWRKFQAAARREPRGGRR